MNCFLSLILFLSPSSIYLGELVPPIQALKLKLGEPVPEDGAFLRPADWIALKIAMESNISMCEWAVSEAVTACINECDQRLKRCDDLETLRATVESYETIITELENDLIRTNQTNRVYLWGIVGTSSLAVISILIWGIK